VNVVRREWRVRQTHTSTSTAVSTPAVAAAPSVEPLRPPYLCGAPSLTRPVACGASCARSRTRVHVVASRCIARSSSGAPRRASRSGHDACRNGSLRARLTQRRRAGSPLQFTGSSHFSELARRKNHPVSRHPAPHDRPHTNPKPP
jgi:hypothetical protein